MPNANTKILTRIIIPVLVVIALVFIIVKVMSNSKSEKEKSVTLSPSTESQPTIASEWQWENSASRKPTKVTTDSGVSLPFTAESVYNALQAVKLDADGNIILDHDALLSLDETLERIHNRLDNESLSILQQMIKDALPGKAGEQTAQIVGDYYRFLGAKEEFSQISEALVDNSNQETLEAVENDEALYAELQALREVHIGNEATERLFRVSDANAQFMFDSMKLARDQSLSPEEKESRRQAIEARHVEQSVNILDWPSRYKAFMDSKQNIIAASIDQEEKQRQLKELFKLHFNSDERQRIAHLGLEQI